MRLWTLVEYELVEYELVEYETARVRNDRIPDSNEIHWIVFDWVRLPNSIELNLMDWVRLGSICSIEFDWFGNRTHTKFGVLFSSIAELNRTQSTDWVRLSSIEFDFRTFDLLCREWSMDLDANDTDQRKGDKKRLSHKVLMITNPVNRASCQVILPHRSMNNAKIYFIFSAIWQYWAR